MIDETKLKTLKDIVCDPESEFSCCDSSELRDAALEWIHFLKHDKKCRYGPDPSDVLDTDEALGAAKAFEYFFNLEEP